MRVMATSDLHGRLPKVPEDVMVQGDLLLLGGDICPDHPIGKRQRYELLDKGGSYQAEWLDTEFRAWLDALYERGITVCAIWGNHDFVGERPSIVPELPWTLIQDELFLFNGLRVWGTPWVPGLSRWAFYGSDEALRVRAEAIPSGIDVLMTHGPPYGTADFVAPQFGSLNVGDPALRDELPRINPKVVVCGHIHEQFGIHRGPSDIPVYNVSHMDEVYEKRRPVLTLWQVSTS